jgi:hypothetical protein
MNRFHKLGNEEAYQSDRADAIAVLKIDDR